MRLPATRRLLALAVTTAVPVGAVAVAGAPAQATTGKSVVIRNIAFSPAKLAVSRGATVTFRFQDGDTNHNVTSVGTKRFKSSPTKGSGTYRVRFTRAGTYRYVCTLHIGMKGSVTVR